jgi:hypothetical protein
VSAPATSDAALSTSSGEVCQTMRATLDLLVDGKDGNRSSLDCMLMCHSGRVGVFGCSVHCGCAECNMQVFEIG